MIQTIEVSKIKGDVEMGSSIQPSQPFSEQELEEVYRESDIRAGAEELVVPWMPNRKLRVDVKSSRHVYSQLYHVASMTIENFRIRRGERIDVTYYTEGTDDYLSLSRAEAIGYDFDPKENANHARKASLSYVLNQLVSIDQKYGLQFLCFTETGASFIRL